MNHHSITTKSTEIPVRTRPTTEKEYSARLKLTAFVLTVAILEAERRDAEINLLRPRLLKFATDLASDKQDLLIDSDSAEQWVQDAQIIARNPFRTKEIKNLYSCLQWKIRGKARDATNSAISYRNKLRDFEGSLKINSDRLRGMYSCPPDKAAEIAELVAVEEATRHWDEI